MALSPTAWANLARSGALEIFGARRQVLWHLGRLQKLAAKHRDQLSFDDPLPLQLPVERPPAFPLPPAGEMAWDFATMNLSSGPHPLALRRPDLGRLGAKPIRELFAMQPGTRVLVAGSVISRQRPPTAKGMCFLILEDESGRLPTAITPPVYEKFTHTLREPGLLIEGRLEAPPEEQRKGSAKGVYRSVLIERAWSLGEIVRGAMQAPLATHGATGHPGENPRAGQRRVAAA